MREIPADGPPLFPSARSLGRRANQAASGADPRLSDARLTVDVNGTEVGLRRRLDLIAGTNVTLGSVDNATDDTVEVTINSTGGGGLTNGDYGDIIVSDPGTGTVLTIDATGTRDDSTFLRGDSTWAHVEATRFAVKNTSGSTLPIGTPVYATGSVGASGATEVAGADASNSAKMPAIGLLEQELLNNGEGFAVPLGVVRGLDTSAYTINGTAFVASGGGLTPTRPTSATALVQNIGRVTRVHASTGEILVMGPGRSNDVPNKIDIANLPTGTTSSDVCIGDDARLSNDRTASGLRTATGIVSVSGASAPTSGQVLTATGATNATWQTPTGPDTKFADSVNQTITMSTTYEVLCSKVCTLSVGDRIEVEVTGTILNNTAASRTYRWQLGVGLMTTEVVPAVGIVQTTSNYTPFFVRAVASVSATNLTRVTMQCAVSGPGPANTSTSTSGNNIRQSWNTTASDLTGANTVKLEMRSDANGATQQCVLHSWSITQTPRRL